MLTHSTTEAELLRQMAPGAKVHVVPWTVPMRPTRVPFDQRHRIALIGGYGHSPNVDAAGVLVEGIMPRVWQTDPAVECLLVGSDMPDAVCRLAGTGVLAIGHMQTWRRSLTG